MNRKPSISRTSIVNIIDFMMAQTGINREQATIAFHTIFHYLKKHPREPLNKLAGYVLGSFKEDRNGSLN